ncbi:MAG: PDZ domain-containing protein, partial [Chlamydiia bacterium]|nr:PDZ domain-containing protein [Chlamydiia bacterium]
PGTDLAVLKVDETGLPFLQFGDSEKLEIGEWVIAVGNPLGLQASLTVGVVSATGRSNLSIAQVEDFIQTDAAINRGNSGGPLLDIEGNVIGVNTPIASAGNGGSMGISFAIPSKIAQHVLHQLMDHGSVSRGYLGVLMQPITTDLAAAFGLERNQGALLAEIVADSPASNSGLQQGDIILEMDGKTFDNVGTLRTWIAMKDPGTQVSFLVLRKGEKTTVPVAMGKVPNAMAQAPKVAQRLGVVVQDIDPTLAGRLGVQPGEGVVISDVLAGSVAQLAGLRKGTVILAVNQKPVASVTELYQTLGTVGQGERVLLLIKQGQSKRFVALKMS